MVTVDDGRSCLQCGADLGKARSDAVFCGQKCKRRYYRRRRSSNYMDPTAWPFQDRAEDRFHEQYEQHIQASQPLTDEDRAIRDWSRRNIGVTHPTVQQRYIDAERERQAREAAEYASHGPVIQPETPLHPESRERGRQRPGQPDEEQARLPQHRASGGQPIRATPMGRRTAVLRCSSRQERHPVALISAPASGYQHLVRTWNLSGHRITNRNGDYEQ